MRKRAAWTAMAWAAAGAAALAGCVSVEATRLDPRLTLAPVAADQVVLYRSPADVPSPYREVALLEASGDGSTLGETAFRESMRDKAAKLGANGVILEPGLEPGPVLKTAAALLDVQYTRYRHGLAIFVPPPAPR